MAIKGFLIKYFKKQVLSSKRDNYSMATIVDNINFLARVSYNLGHRSFIITARSVALTNPCKRTHWHLHIRSTNEVHEVCLLINFPLIAEIYYSRFSMINHYNCICSKECRVDKHIAIQNWDIRMNFNLLSMIFVNCWSFYKAARFDQLDVAPYKFFSCLQKNSFTQQH